MASLRLVIIYILCFVGYTHAVSCSDGSICAESYPCCLMDNHKYQCCPFEKGICCDGGIDCCPPGSVCDSTTPQGCRLNSSQMQFLNDLNK